MHAVQSSCHMYMYMQCFPQDKQKGGEGDLAVAQSVKLYLGTCILHLKSRCTETDSEQFLLDLCYALCLYNQFLYCYERNSTKIILL